METNVTVVRLLVSEQAAFGEFSRLVTQGLMDPRGNRVEADFGDYAHVVANEERLTYVSWIAPTIHEPEKILLIETQSRAGRPFASYAYVRRLREAKNSEVLWFVVFAEKTVWGLRLRTWFVPDRQDEYIDQLQQKGELIWPRP